jgi:exonuclease SbcD
LTLRILHTSDWHLGSSLESASRDDEHRRFLDWLLVTLRDEAIDVLIVAGDVFHYAQPSAEAQRLYYRFLARIGGETKVRQIVVIGGNHDSASRLDAPREVLDALRIHVVGGLATEQTSWERCLCPIESERPGGGVDAVVLAVPFVHEFRLGIRTTGRSPAEITADFREAFKSLYTRLADLAEKRWPGAPLLATGHLTCVGAQAGEYGTEIHQVGTIGGLPGDIFDPRLEYIALGHIHRMFPIEGTRARYSGSPLAMNVLEARSQRFVIRIDLDASLPAGERATTHKIPVPSWREIVEVSGPTEEVLSTLRALKSPLDLPPFVYVKLEVDEYLTDGAFRVNEAIETHPLATRPRVVEIHQKVAGREDVKDDGAERTSLKKMKPEDVFIRLHQAQFKTAPGDLLLTAFRTVLSQLDEPHVTEEGAE